MARQSYPDWKEFHFILDDLMKANNETQEALASAIAVNRQNVSAWFNNGSIPRAEVVAKIAAHYETSPEVLLAVRPTDANDVFVEMSRLTGLPVKFFQGLVDINKYHAIQTGIPELGGVDTPMDYASMAVALVAEVFDTSDGFRNKSLFSDIWEITNIIRMTDDFGYEQETITLDGVQEEIPKSEFIYQLKMRSIQKFLVELSNAHEKQRARKPEKGTK